MTHLPPPLQHYIAGQWTSGDATDVFFLNHAIHGTPCASVSRTTIDIQQVMDHARCIGNPLLRKMTFQERGRMLKALALHLNKRKEQFYATSWATGATRADAWIDIEGGIGNLFNYASLRKQFGDVPFAVDGDPIPLGKKGTFMGHHIMVPKTGAALHINAFNFPVWGMLEKVAVNWMAGVPAIVKPATATCFLTEAVVREIIASGILPDGAIQLICGPARNLLEAVDERDVVTFTGSAVTGKMLRSNERINQHSVPFNMEADSLNAAILGEQVEPGDPEFELFIKEVRKEMTVKCGQKCTAVRRIIVPERLIDAVQEALIAQLTKTTKGDPQQDGVRMGALVNREQRDEVLSQVALLEEEAECVYRDESDPIGASSDSGTFLGPMLLRMNAPMDAVQCHEVEAFGPVSTLMPYTEIDQAIKLANRGKGSLCCSFVSHESNEVTHFVQEAAVMHGRILVLDRDCAAESTGHGSPLPQLVHGGPGRAGGGEEMGGVRGIAHYMQRTAIQGSPTLIGTITQTYQPGGKQVESEPHLFRKYFEELKIGETVTTAKHTVTEADIVNFANVSGDHFYAHMDSTSLDGTIFTERVAHGYFLLSKAAGLFVEPRKGPVLLNYGIEQARFTKPVYPGTTIGVRLTVKEKIAQEKREPEDVAKGIVKYYVDMYDDTGESVAIATILTMVKMRKQD